MSTGSSKGTLGDPQTQRDRFLRLARGDTPSPEEKERLVPDREDQVAELTWNVLSGGAAVHRHQYAVADRWLGSAEQALEQMVLEHPLDESCVIPYGELLLVRARLLFQQRRYEDARPYLDTFDRLSSQHKGPPWWPLAGGLLQARLAYKAEGNLVMALGVFLKLADDAAAGGYQMERGEALLGVGRLLDLAGEFELAAKVLHAAVAVFERMLPNKEIGNAHDLLGRVYYRSGTPAAANALLEQAARELGRSASEIDETLARYHLAVSVACTGDMEAAESLADEVRRRFAKMLSDDRSVTGCAARFGTDLMATQLVLAACRGRPTRKWEEALGEFVDQLDTCLQTRAKSRATAEFARMLADESRPWQMPRDADSPTSKAWLARRLQSLFAVVPPYALDPSKLASRLVSVAARLNIEATEEALHQAAHGVLHLIDPPGAEVPVTLRSAVGPLITQDHPPMGGRYVEVRGHDLAIVDIQTEPSAEPETWVVPRDLMRFAGIEVDDDFLWERLRFLDTPFSFLHLLYTSWPGDGPHFNDDEACQALRDGGSK